MLVFQDSNSVENYAFNAHIYNPCEFGYHFHKNYELIYVTDGEIEAEVDGKEFVIEKGCFSLILPYNIHRMHTPSAAGVWIGVFSSDYIKSFDRFMNGKANKNTVFRAEDELMPYIGKLLTCERPELFTAQSILYAVCSAYVRSGDFYASSRESNDLPIKIFNYTKENFKKDISLKKVAADLGYDYHYLSRAYHRIFHTNYRNLLNQFRINCAMELLGSGLSVAEIAMTSGFGSIRTLNRCFRDTYGKAPGQLTGSVAEPNPLRRK